jgi:mono/diheme cytochrome c family protein
VTVVARILGRSRLLSAAGMMSLAMSAFAQDHPGRTLFVDAGKGNCSSCHQAPADKSVNSLSTIGPPLAAIRERYADRAKLVEDIAATVMPPYLRHRISTSPEIERIADYVSTL